MSRVAAVGLPEAKTSPTMSAEEAAGYAEHASWQSIAARLDTARMQRRRWDSHIEWLEGLLAERCQQAAKGEWPPTRTEGDQTP